MLRKGIVMNDNCFNIIGNENVIGTITSMIKSNRLSHAFLLYGEKGVGKKTIAKYIAASILCESKSGKPCKECKSCKMVCHNGHPDLKMIHHNSKVKGFSVDNARKIVTDAYIKPNEGDYKVYIFQDCDTMSALTQNTLLKIIEEPPSDTIFIFTATSKAVFLPTIISRVISFGISPVSLKECKAELIRQNIFEAKNIDDAIEAFGGNIGMCLQYLNNDELSQDVQTARNIVDNINSGSEYFLLKSIYALDGKKEKAKTVISLLLNIIRDCSVARTGSNSFIGCYKQGAKKLATTITLKQAQEIYNLLETTSLRIDGNANLSLCLTGMCCQIKSILN